MGMLAGVSRSCGPTLAGAEVSPEALPGWEDHFQGGSPHGWQDGPVAETSVSLQAALSRKPHECRGVLAGFPRGERLRDRGGAAAPFTV